MNYERQEGLAGSRMTPPASLSNPVQIQAVSYSRPESSGFT
jgi:hypothetical protein